MSRKRVLRNVDYPKVEFLPGSITMSGRSIPQDAFLFYDLLIRQIQEVVDRKRNLTFNFKMSYYNTGSSMYMTKILKILKKLSKHAKVIVNWYYLDIDEEFVISAYIPESIFRATYNQSLGAVEIHWHMDKYSEIIMQDPADFSGPSLISDLNLMYYAVHPSEIFDWYYIPPEGIHYEEGWQWEVHSWQENFTLGGGEFVNPESASTYDAESLPSRLKTASDDPVTAQEWKEPESFYDLNLMSSIATYDNASNTWIVKWTGKFNERVFLGTYRVDMSLYSNTGERINLWGFSSWDFESNDNPENG